MLIRDPAPAKGKSARPGQAGPDQAHGTARAGTRAPRCSGAGQRRVPSGGRGGRAHRGGDRQARGAAALLRFSRRRSTSIVVAARDAAASRRRARSAAPPARAGRDTARAAPASARRFRAPRRPASGKRGAAGGSRRRSPRPGRRARVRMVSAAVHGPMPLNDRRRRSPSVVRQVGDALKLGRDGRRRPDHVRPTTLDTKGVERPVGKPRQLLGRRRHPQAERSRRGLAEAHQQALVCAARFLAGDLLAQDRQRPARR